MPRRNKDSRSTAVAERPAARRAATLPKRNQSPSNPVQTQAAVPAWRKRLAEFRFLAVVLGASAALALYESSQDGLPRTIAEVPPTWLMDERRNMAQTLTELYPDRSYGYFLRSYQAAMCWDQQFTPPVCSAFAYKDLRDVRLALEEAIARGGSAEQEELFHFYAHILARSNEPPEVVNEAIGQWRRHYPRSKKPDPWQMAAASATMDK